MQNEAADGFGGQQAHVCIQAHDLTDVEFFPRVFKQHGNEQDLAEDADNDVDMELSPLHLICLVAFYCCIFPLNEGCLSFEETRIVLIEVFRETNHGALRRRPDILLLGWLALIFLRHRIDLLIVQLCHESQCVNVFVKEDTMAEANLTLSILTLLQRIWHCVISFVDK